jgi:HD superfamily phosphodiesterase
MITTSHDELREKLKAYLDRDPRLRSVVTYTKRRFGDEKKLTAHNWEHIYRDTLNAIVIGEAEGADMRVVLPAIVMHDIGYLYGPPEGHGPRGADKLPAYLDDAGISYPVDEIAKQASCIRTHKGSMRDDRPDGLEAKVVADADLLEKFGAFGVYQAIRTMGEMDWPLRRILDFMLSGKGSALTLETETGRQLAEPGRRFVLDFFRELARAAAPYGDSSL